MRTLKLILEILFWSFAASAAMFVTGIVLGLIFAPVVGYIAVIAVIGFLPIGVRLARNLRRRRAAMTLQYLDQAVRLNLPLARVIRAAQLGESGAMAMRLAQFRQLLEEGYSLSAALEGGVPELGERETALIESAERVGRLGHTLRGLVHEQATISRQKGNADAAFFRAYPMVMAVAVGSVVSTLSIYVFPKYQRLFMDYGLKLPPITTRTLALADTLGPQLIAVLGTIVLIASGASLWQMVHPVRLGRTFIRRWRDHLAWITPILHGLERDRGLADAFDLIADALAAGMPIERVLAEAGGLSINVVLRDRFQAWAEALSRGASLAEAARTAWMPALVAGMLGSTPHDRTAAADVFLFLARYYRARFSRAAATLAAVSVPAVVFLFGVIVAAVALAMFTPLISIIDTLSSHSGKWVL